MILSRSGMILKDVSLYSLSKAAISLNLPPTGKMYAGQFERLNFARIYRLIPRRNFIETLWQNRLSLRHYILEVPLIIAILLYILNSEAANV